MYTKAITHMWMWCVFWRKLNIQGEFNLKNFGSTFGGGKVKVDIPRVKGGLTATNHVLTIDVLLCVHVCI